MLKSNSIEIEITNIMKNICDLVEKVFAIIKESENNYDNDISNDNLYLIENIYTERDLLIDKLKNILETTENIILLKNNPQWIRYTTEIINKENFNIDFFSKQIKITKNKLTELFNQKSLMIYNKKVELNYENKFL
ncbi:hypothetical protein SDC9_149906 [bioreactor metagenome]|uniref:Uncharacterized protein n=1 Tax=bioreactor metagenome TaxID=1076179 RepID=A0A645EMV7_9ZZZZ